MRIRIVVLALLPFAALLPGAGVARASVVREPVSFEVTNPATPGTTYTVKGTLVRPSEGCSGSVLLAMHGLSYGQWAWDFPIEPETYSVAQALAARGFAVLAVDELGYGSSAGAGSPDQPNGYSLSVEGYADMTAQMVRQLRAGTYGAASPVAFDHVGLIGHSAGAEIVELTAALNPGLVDVLIPTAYTHEPFVNNDWLVRSWIPDNQEAATSDYVYFETLETRAADMYHLANADPDVVAWDMAHANLTPSGEIYSIGSQPSRFVVGLVRIPVLLVLAEHDELFPGSFGESELQWFAGTDDLTLEVIPDAGHSFMLHRNAPVANDTIADWLEARASVFPTC